MKKILAITLILSTTACASITTGSSQNLSVDTFPQKEARCQLTNDKGSWFINQTPGSVTVSRAYSPLNVSCEKDGWKGISTVQSKTKGIVFANIVFGLVGVVVGGAIDVGTGAAYDYTPLINVNMTDIRKEVSSN